MASRSSESVSFERRDEENQLLREENARLRRVLRRSRNPCSTVHTRGCTSGSNNYARGSGKQGGTRSQTDRALPEPVRGREDVYARRWENSDGRSGYSPAALKDWKAINSSRPEDRKKVDRNTRKSLPLSDVVIENHLLGKETIGIYPLLPDETCWFLAVDFDKKTWTDDSRAFLDTCQELNVPAALERSRSGNGGHVWIFFEHAIPANTARKLGCAVLTRTMERRH